MAARNIGEIAVGMLQAQPGCIGPNAVGETPDLGVVVDTFQLYKTIPPDGLMITRKGGVFTFTWKIADANYSKGQVLQWKTTGGKWQTVSVSKIATTTAVTVNYAGFKPTTSSALTAVQFRVKGHRANWQKLRKDGSVKAVYTTVESEWTKYVFNIAVPDKPKVNPTALSNENVNECTFAVTGYNRDDTNIINRDCLWQSVLVKNCSYTDGSKAPWDSRTLGWQTGTLAPGGGSVRIAENSSILGASYTRWFRVKTRGVAGESAWTYSQHVYASPYPAVVNTAHYSANGGGRVATVRWTADSDVPHPIDSVTLQYTVVTPGAHVSCPANASWSDMAQIRDTAKQDGTSVDLTDVPEEDEAAFVRIITTHDNRTTASQPKLLKTGPLQAPENLTASIDQSTYIATISAENKSTVSGAFLVVTAKTVKQPSGYICAVIPAGSTTTTAHLPASVAGQDVTFGVYAVVGYYTLKGGVYTTTEEMRSATVTTGGTVPAAPSNVTLSGTTVPGTIRVAWDWSWASATCAELSWADHPDAWESTDEPSTYVVNRAHVASWNISELEVGVDWWVRVRLGREENDEITWGQYSDIGDPIKLSSAPAIPSLELSADVIPATGTVEASWVYATTDGTPQASATVAEVIISGGITSYRKLAITETAQHVTLSAKSAGWQTGTAHNIVVRVTSASGQMSDGWSEPVSLMIADEVTAEITQTSLVEETDYNALTELPLTVTVTGAGTGGITTVIIERAAEYHVSRPDESIFNGYEGETIAVLTQNGESQMTITADDLIGHLDEGAPYTLIATVQDSYGQSAEASVSFRVEWAEAAIIPEAEVTIDTDEMVAIITPIAPAGASETAVCDIYRLSVDRPVLVYQGASFGEQYVDPFPTIGDLGGHRIVYRTAEGNTVTAAGQFAWIDLHEAEDDILRSDFNIIDWDTGRVFIAFNIDLSSSWEKDFTETQYLGGSVQGDWNPAISRTGTVDTASMAVYNDDVIQAMRRLATYAGICHIRTKDGSSFAADIQVSEDRGQDAAHKVVKFGLSITRVDTEGLDGMTYDEWQEIQQDEEEEP